MSLKDALNEFYYNAALYDLKMLNKPSGDDKLTYNSFLYLELVYYLNGNATVSDLATLLNISKPAVTIKIGELEKQGLVIKKTNPEDRRQSFLCVNEDAVPRIKMYKRMDDVAVHKIESLYSAEDIEKFCDMLRIVSSTNNEIDENL